MVYQFYQIYDYIFLLLYKDNMGCSQIMGSLDGEVGLSQMIAESLRGEEESMVFVQPQSYFEFLRFILSIRNQQGDSF